MAENTQNGSGYSQQEKPKQSVSLQKRRYRQRNKIERTFCRLKDARRIATRYDKSAKTFLRAICLVAIVYWWLN